MTCQNCEEKKAKHHYGDLIHLCDDCNAEYLDEVAKDYGMITSHSSGREKTTLRMPSAGRQALHACHPANSPDSIRP